MFKQYRVLVLLVALLTCVFLFFWEKENKKKNVNLNSHIVVQVTDMGLLPWDPRASISTQWTFNSAVFGHILTFDNSFKIQPGVIKSWLWSESTKSYTLKVDPSLVYHDGQKLNLVDIEFAIVKLFISDFSVVRKELLSDIVGTEKLQPAQKFKSGMLDGVKLIGDGYLQIFLKKRNPVFLYSLALATPAISPIATFNDDYFTYKGSPVGLGKYKFVSMDRGRGTITVVRNYELDEGQQDVCDDCPKNITFIESGRPIDNNVDIGIAWAASELSHSESYRVIKSSTPSSILSIDFNFEHKDAGSFCFRKDVAQIVNRKLLWHDYPAIKSSEQLVASHFYGQTDGLQSDQTLSKCKSWNDRRQKVRMKGWFHGQPFDPLPRYIKRLQSQLKENGIEVTFHPTIKQYFGKESRDVGIYVYGTSASFADPSAIFSLYLESYNRKNHLPKAIVPEGRAYLREYRDSKSPADKAIIIKKVARLFKNNYVQVPLGQRYQLFTLSQKIEGIGDSTGSFAINFDEVKLSK